MVGKLEIQAQLFAQRLEETRVQQYSDGYLDALAQCSESFEQMPPEATIDDAKQVVEQIRSGDIPVPDPSLSS